MGAGGFGDAGDVVHEHHRANAAAVGDGVSELQTSLAAWTTRRRRRSSCNTAARRFRAMPDGPLTGLAGADAASSLSRIRTTRSADRRLRSAAEWFGGTGGTVNGTTFYGFITRLHHFPERGRLEHVVQAVAELHACADARDRPRDRARPHADRGSVPTRRRTSCIRRAASTATPTPPAIGPDDLAGLNFIYPSGAPPLHLLINPTAPRRRAAAAADR